MDLDPVTEDDPEIDHRFPSKLEHMIIDSDGSKMLGVMFRAKGQGPHPTTVILHGFPGHERNLDLAHVLQRAGWNAVVFHYRGAWGSEGEFSFSNMVEDVHACLEHLRDPEWFDVVDSDRITLIGHSMGGWAAIMASLEDPSILQVGFIAGFNLGILKDFVQGSEFGRRMVQANFRVLVSPLKGACPEDLIEEVVEKGDGWNILDHIEEVRQMKILIIGAKKDTVAPPELHHIPISGSMEGSGINDLTIRMLDSDHNFSDRRILLSRTILEWMANT